MDGRKVRDVIIGRQLQADGLVPGACYILMPHGLNEDEAGEMVTFVGFTPCPATVIVFDRLKRRLYCGRERLFQVTIDTPGLDNKLE
jgi:hypothetical protein